jgi:hypothetical protein
MNWRTRGGLALEVAIILLVGIAVWLVVMYYMSCRCEDALHGPSADPRVAKLQDKLDAVRRLNEARNGTPPVNLIELNAPKWRVVQHIKHRVDAYDVEGRHPVYWYTKLDGGLYGVEEVIVWSLREYLPVNYPPERLGKISFREGVEVALGKRRDALLNPCYNYVDMEATVVEEYVGDWKPRYKNVWKVYIFYMVAKWVNWTSLPTYFDGRFTAEGYADPVMRPVAFVVRYAPYERRSLNIRAAYKLGTVYFCKYLNPPSSCKDALEPEGTFAVSRVLDDGRWYVKIDAYVQLNRTGLYTFELIAEDLRFQGRRCPLMHYTIEVIEVPKKP